MAYDVPQLLMMSREQLDQLFRRSEAGPIPNGLADGTLILAPGTVLSPHIAELIRLFMWQGKVFDAKNGVLRNRVLPLGLSAVAARVYRGTSRLDGKECIILDYSRTSLVARWIKDEIRLIGPGQYLGRAYWIGTRLLDFVLQFRVPRRNHHATHQPCLLRSPASAPAVPAARSPYGAAPR